MLSIPYSPEKHSASEASSPAPHSPKLPEREIPLIRQSLDPRSWTRRTWLLLGAILVTVIVVIVAATVGSILGARARFANAYPDYYRIDYKLTDTYSGPTFFDKFNYFTGPDPTEGFVHYVDSTGNLTSTTSPNNNTTSRRSSLSTTGSAILRVDHTNTSATNGRRSIRITSKSTYTTGLFIFDILHTPYGCGTWPALWLTDVANWPLNGEIDVLETVNMGDTGNQMTLHTGKGCQIGEKRKRRQTGTALSYDCYNATNYNAGCGVQGPTNSFGEQFNTNGGGVYALELRSEGIRIWLFERAHIPYDILNQQPDPSTWGTPLADFPNLECDVTQHFRNMSIIANIDLCGSWAGTQSVYSQNPLCTGFCKDYVTWRPVDFEKAFWEFGGWWVYERAA